MSRLLRDGCFFINHHHHNFRIGLPTIHFRRPNLTQFCLCCELCLLRCFGYLGTLLPTPTLCIVHHLTLHFRIAYSQNPSLHFCNPIELPQPPPHPATTILTFEILSSRFLRFLRCFGYLGTSLHHLGISIKITATHHRHGR